MAENNSEKRALFPALNALFQPAAETLGEELNRQVTHWLNERRRRKQARNIEHHLQGVKRRLETDRRAELPNQRQLDFFAEWVEGVQEIDSHDEIAQVWQGLMAAVLREPRGEQERLLESLKKLEPSEAAFLVTTFRNSDSVTMYADQRTRFFLSRLEVLDLAKGPTPIPWTPILISLVFIVPLLLWFIAWVSSILPYKLPAWTALITMAIGMLGWYSFSRDRRTFSLTENGIRLMKFVR